MKKFFVLAFFLSAFLLHAVEEKPMVIIIPSYNNKQWSNANLRSVLDQEYSNYKIIYIDDNSSDGTKDQVENLLKEDPRSYRSFFFNENNSLDISKITEKFKEAINAEKVFFTLVSNQTRNGALANQYRAIHSCENDEIIVLLDGDDWLANNGVLQKINALYTSNDIWMTHGSLMEYPSGTTAWCEPIPPHIIANNSFRDFKCPSHLRTFYAGIFKKIQLKDLLYRKNFFPMTGDMAIMYPIVEMCGERHLFVPEALYIYNMQNPINDNKINATLQKNLDQLIRKKTPYQRLDHR